MMETSENGKKPNIRPNFPPLRSIFSCEFYFYQQLDIVQSYYPMQFKGKLMNQIWENSEKPNREPNFDPFDPNLMVDIVASCHRM